MKKYIFFKVIVNIVAVSLISFQSFAIANSNVSEKNKNTAITKTEKKMSPEDEMQLRAFLAGASGLTGAALNLRAAQWLADHAMIDAMNARLINAGVANLSARSATAVLTTKAVASLARLSAAGLVGAASYNATKGLLVLDEKYNDGKTLNAISNNSVSEFLFWEFDQKSELINEYIAKHRSSSKLVDDKSPTPEQLSQTAQQAFSAKGLGSL